MFTRQEASRIREEFWTVFGKYMSPVLSSEGLRINWVNYHTRTKDVYFRMDANSKWAEISISLEQRDLGVQELYFQQFLELRTLLYNILKEEWTWQLHVKLDDGKVVSKISKMLPAVSVLNRDQWSDLISFFKPRIIALDAFWEDAKYSFDGLQ
jgi:hypothetical protein